MTTYVTTVTTTYSPMKHTLVGTLISGGIPCFLLLLFVIWICYPRRGESTGKLEEDESE
jgi:hypothetical protein